MILGSSCGDPAVVLRQCVLPPPLRRQLGYADSRLWQRALCVFGRGGAGAAQRGVSGVSRESLPPPPPTLCAPRLPTLFAPTVNTTCVNLLGGCLGLGGEGRGCFGNAKIVQGTDDHGEGEGAAREGVTRPLGHTPRGLRPAPLRTRGGRLGARSSFSWPREQDSPHTRSPSSSTLPRRRPGCHRAGRD